MDASELALALADKVRPSASQATLGGAGALAVGTTINVANDSMIGRAADFIFGTGDVVDGIAGSLVSIGTTVVLTGMAMMIVLPLIPLFYFYTAVLNWLFQIVELMFAIPLAILQLFTPSRDATLVGNFQQVLLAVFSVFMRPFFMVVGLILTMMLLAVALTYLHELFSSLVFFVYPGGAGSPGLADATCLVKRWLISVETSDSAPAGSAASARTRRARTAGKPEAPPPRQRRHPATGRPSRPSGAERGLTAERPPHALPIPARVTGGDWRACAAGLSDRQSSPKVPAPRPAPCPRFAGDEGAGWACRPLGAALEWAAARSRSAAKAVGMVPDMNDKRTRSIHASESGRCRDRGTDNPAPLSHRHRTTETGNGT